VHVRRGGEGGKGEQILSEAGPDLRDAIESLFMGKRNSTYEGGGQKGERGEMGRLDEI